VSSPVLVVGSVALDDIHTPSGEVRAAEGASASYFALAARHFAPVRIVAVVGSDFPSEHRALMEACDIDTRGLEVAAGETFRWGGRYADDLNDRTTLFTHLNVFEGFHPNIPEALRNTPYVFLGNIHPALQAEVLRQVQKPRLVALDTMNLWIDTARSELLDVLPSVDVLVLNDGEARQLANDSNLLRAAQRLLGLGPATVVVKKGEHGAMMLTAKTTFCVPAMPLEKVQDPTGAGDAFAGGFLGHLARRGEHDEEDLRCAVGYGTVVASYTVEAFGVRGLYDVDAAGIEARFAELRNLTQFGAVRSLQKSRHQVRGGARAAG
jgi:sugar/nucleoside kinase (ribokinase family)